MRAVVLGCLCAASSVAWATPGHHEVGCTDSHVEVGVSMLEQGDRRGTRMQGAARARTWCGDSLEASQATLVDLVLADLCQISELDGARCEAVERAGRQELSRALTEPRLVAISLDLTGEGEGRMGDVALTFEDASTRRLSGSVHDDGRFETRSVVLPPADGPDDAALDCTVSLRVTAEGRVHHTSPARIELKRTRTLLCRSPVGNRFLKLEVEHGETAAPPEDGVVSQDLR